ILVGKRGDALSLSPASLLRVERGARLVIPSPNGATLSLATGATPTFVACLRNCRAVAEAAQRVGRRIGIIPAGEQWPDGTLRPAIEDWIGAGAIIGFLRGTKSPEADAALAAYRECADHLFDRIRACSSGRELIERGFEADVRIAAEYDV